MFSVISLTDMLESFFVEFALDELSDFEKHGGENTSYAEITEDNRGPLLSVEQPKWCRARAPLVVHRNLHFYTCLPSIRAHVLYRTHTGFFFLNSIVFTVFPNTVDGSFELIK